MRLCMGAKFWYPYVSYTRILSYNGYPLTRGLIRYPEQSALRPVESYVVGVCVTYLSIPVERELRENNLVLSYLS